MARDKWIFKEIKVRQSQGPPWLSPPKGERATYYILRHDPKSNEVMVFRNGHFGLPRSEAPKNKSLEQVAFASSPQGLTGEYVDFLIPGSPERFQTTRSLLEEVFEGKNPRKLQKKETRKTVKRVSRYGLVRDQRRERTQG